MKMSSVCELDGEEPDWAGIYWREGVGLPFGDCAIAKEIECGWSYSENKIIRVVVSYSRAL